MEEETETLENKFILFNPPSFDFGVIPISNQPKSFSSKILNASNNIAVLKFSSISTDSIWFTSSNKISEEQYKSSFNIFNMSKPISDLIIMPNESKTVFCTVVPSKINRYTLPLKVAIPIHIYQRKENDDKIINNNDNNLISTESSIANDNSFILIRNYEKQISISASVSTPRFKINPKILFLDDCIVNTSQTAKFSIKNSSKFPISIVIYPPPFVEIATPKYPNFVKIDPSETVDLTLTHFPQKVGQFDHKIAFDCIESTELPKILHLMTSVSPHDTPSNFPIIKIESKKHVLNFGEIHSGQLVESSFVIENNSDNAYDLLIAGIVDIFSPIISDVSINQSANNINNLNNTLNSSVDFGTMSQPENLLSGSASANISGSSTITSTIVATPLINPENFVLSSVLKEQLKIGCSRELKFKTILSAQYDSKLQLTLHPHSSVPIFVGYTPFFNLSVNSDTFDRRNFMITLVFNGSEIYYRHIKCSAAVCNSQIKIEPSVIHLGDIIAGTLSQAGVVQITNISPLKTTVKIKSSVKSLMISPSQVEISPKSTINYTFSFYPKKVNSEFSGIITFSNVNNPNNEVRLTVEAAVIASASESQHSMSYSINSGGHHLTNLDFNFVPQNFISARTFILKNKMKSPLVIKFTSSSPDELFLYYDEKFNAKTKRTSSSLADQSLNSNLSSSNTIINIPDKQSQQQTDLNESSNILLTPDSPLKPINELAEYTRKFASFYENQYFLSGNKYSDLQIVEHFETLLNQFKENITKGTLQNVEGSEIELPPSAKMELCAVLIPKGDKSYIWKRKQLEFSIELDSKITNVPRSFPVVFNTCESISFLSSQSLNFGTIQVNTHSQYSLNLENESSIPLLFRLILDSDVPITFDQNKNYGIVSPFSLLTIPFSIAPKIDGRLLSSIAISNILNINEDRRVQLKGRVVRRSHFFIDPQEIDFGDVTAGTSSPKSLIFVTNTSSSENEFTFSNVPKEIYGNNVQPIISYQFKDTKARLLTDKVKLQIEKLGCKLRCLQRKKKWEYAEQIQKVIDELSNTAIESTSLQIKQLGEKFMNRVVYKAEPLQLHCIEVQMIPIISKKLLKEPENIEGTIMIYESGRVDSQKHVKYKARVVPQKKIQMSETEINTGLLIEPSSIKIDNIYIQETKRIELTIKNIEKNEENFWILSNSSDNAIITSQTNEGKLQSGESISIPIDIYCSDAGTITKKITVASQTCWKEIPLTINAEYRQILQLSTSKIDFGQIQLTSLQTIEKRTSMTITNISDSVLYVVISHSMPFLYIYENDPEELQFKPLRVDVQSSITINILFKPQLEIEKFRKYKTFALDSFLEVKAYDIKEEAENSLNDSHSAITSPYYKVNVPVLGRIGRIGLRTSVKVIDFDSLSNQENVETKMTIKNRSSKLDVDVVTSPTQGIIIEPSAFSLKGHQEFELTVKFTPSSWGVNEGFIFFSINSNQLMQNSYMKKVTVTSFVDPKIIEVDIDDDHKNVTKIDLGKFYLQKDGTPISKVFSINVRNVSRYATSFSIPKIEKKFTIKPKEGTSIRIQFPFKIANVLALTDSSINNSDSNKKKSSIASAAAAALAIAEPSFTSSAQNIDNNDDKENTNKTSNENEDHLKLSVTKSTSNSNLIKPEQTIFTYNLLFITAATKKVIKSIKLEGKFVVSIGSLLTDTISLGRFGGFNNWIVEPSLSNTVIIHNQSNIDLYMNSSIFSDELKKQSSAVSVSCLRIPNQIGPIPPNSDFQVKVEPIIEMMKSYHLEGPQSNLIVFTNNNNHDNKLKLTVNYDVRDSFIQVDRAKRGASKDEFIVSLYNFTEIVVNNGQEENSNNNSQSNIILINNDNNNNTSSSSSSDNIIDTGKDNEIVTSYVASCWFSITNLLEREVTVEVLPEIEKSVSKFVNVELFQRKTKLKLTSFEIQPNEPFEISVKVTKLKRKWNSEDGVVFAKLNFKTENSKNFLVSVVYHSTTDKT